MATTARSNEAPTIIARSAAMRQVLATLDRVARYRTTVLLLGESGTGKDVLARQFHARGPGKAARFEPMNCAMLDREILESELFGHEKGAFTGAHAQKRGLFEVADGGTLFLDEIGELDLGTQAKLLRVLDHRQFRRLGGNDIIRVDLSLVTATNRDLPALVAAGRFRDDLYFRLRVVNLVVPPLRERKEDIPELVALFVKQFNARHGANIRGVSRGLMKRFVAHDWPGNIRELRNAIESAAVFALGAELGESDAEASGFLVGHVTAPRGVPADAQTLEEAERALVAARLKALGSREATARSLGIGVRTLYAKIRRYGLA